VAAGAQCPVTEVDAVCEALVRQHHFLDDTGLTTWPDATRGGSYRFQHALYQQVLYEQVGTARRMQLHRHIGARAGDNAARRNAYHEAIAALTKGLALLTTLPDTPERTEHELALQLTLGQLLSAVRGRTAPEVGPNPTLVSPAANSHVAR
jgi:hypothetical protein